MANYLSELKKIGGALVVALSALVLASCASTPFRADVSRFQAMPTPQGQTFAIQADDPALAGGLEFAQYAELVRAQMEGMGYKSAASPEEAQMVLHLSYGVDKGRERPSRRGFYGSYFDPWYGYSYASPFYFRSAYGYGSRWYGSRWRGGGAWGYGFYDPWFDYGGDFPDIVYTSALSLKIDNKADGQRLFEGKAEAASLSNRLPYLVPNMIEAMFTGFPGNSGETLRISIKPEKPAKKPK